HQPFEIGKQIITPIQRCVQGLMSRRRGPASRPKQGKLAVEQLRNAPYAIGLNPAGRELDGQRHAAEFTANASDNRSIFVGQPYRHSAGGDAFQKYLYGWER